MSEDAGWKEKKRKQTGLDCAGLRGKANAGRRIRCLVAWWEVHVCCCLSEAWRLAVDASRSGKRAQRFKETDRAWRCPTCPVLGLAAGALRVYGVVHSWEERACDAVLGVLRYLMMADVVL